MKLLYQNPSKEDWFLVAWTLSNKCNYRCDYCPSFLHDGSTGHPKWETVKHFIENFKVDKKDICYRISGGEPTYWKHFIDMARLIKQQGHYFSFLSNGSQSVEYYKEISRYSDGIMLSFHEKYSDPDHFINIANAVECPVVVNLMLVKDKFDELIKIAEHLYNNTSSLAVWPKVVLDKTSVDYVTNDVSDYDQNQKNIIKQWPYFRKINDDKIHRGELMLDGNKITGNDIIIKGLNNHQGWQCWGGLHMISIDMWGDIYRSECRQGGKLGTLEQYQMPTEVLTCGATRCSCLSDIYLRKESKDII